MKEIIMNVSDDTYSAVENFSNKMVSESVAITQAFDNYPWLRDLFEAARRGVNRNEILKHNKSTSHIFEQCWLKDDCERYETTVDAHLQSIAYSHPQRDIAERECLAGIPQNDPEHDYMVSKLNEA